MVLVTEHFPFVYQRRSMEGGGALTVKGRRVGFLCWIDGRDCPGLINVRRPGQKGGLGGPGPVLR